MKKYSIELKRTDSFIVEIDEKIWTPEAIKKWSCTFWDAETPEDISKHLAISISRLGTNEGFYEGFSYVKIYCPDGSLKRQYKGLEPIAEDDYAKGILIKLCGADVEVEANEINDKP